MHFASIIPALWAATLAASQYTAQIYIQPTTSTLSPSPLAEITYSLTEASIIDYSAPEIPSSAATVRVGIYNPHTSQWLSSITVASAENFAKGYSPNLVLSTSAQGDVLSVMVKGVQIDAGVTRDFGPKALVVVEGRGKQPELNKPVVLSPEGKKVEEVEKTIFQKYVSLKVRLGTFANERQVLVGSCCSGVFHAQWWRFGQVDVHLRMSRLLGYRHKGWWQNICHNKYDQNSSNIRRCCDIDIATTLGNQSQ